MFILTVSPITKGASSGTLSYYTTKDIPVGSLVTVPIRKAVKPALVIDRAAASESKGEIKKLPYQFKKIQSVTAPRYFSEGFLRVLHRTADHFVTTPGAVLYTLIPQGVLNGLEGSGEKNDADQGGSGSVFEQFCVQSPLPGRIDAYKGLVRENLSQKCSTLFLCPDQHSADELFTSLKKGVENYTFLLHGGLSEKILQQNWSAALALAHPVVIVMTPGSLSIPRRDIGSIVVEEEGSRSYTPVHRPYISYVYVAEHLARELNAHFVVGDLPLSLRSLWKYENNQIVDLSASQNRIPFTARPAVIDMTREIEVLEKQKEYRTFISPELTRELQRLEEKHAAHTFLFTPRKGLAPVMICADCGSTITCPDCSSPLSLHTIKQKRILLCSLCGTHVAPQDTCTVCGGWRVTQLGAGSERIEELIKEWHPRLNVFRIDKVATSTTKKAVSVMNDFIKRGGVLVGTELAISHLPNNTEIDTAAVVSLDTLFSIPDFSMNEKIFRLLSNLGTVARSSFLIQTRTPSHPLLTTFQTGNIAVFYREEIALREQLQYPPFSVLIKVSLNDKPSVAKRNIEELAGILAHHKPYHYLSTVNGKKMHSILLKLPAESWVDPELLSILRSLPAKYIVSIDPVRIL